MVKDIQKGLINKYTLHISCASTSTSVALVVSAAKKNQTWQKLPFMNLSISTCNYTVKLEII